MKLINSFHGYLTARFDRKIDELYTKMATATRFGFFRPGSQLFGQDVTVRQDLYALSEHNRYTQGRRDIRKRTIALQKFLMKHYKFFDRVDDHLSIHHLFETMLLPG